MTQLSKTYGGSVIFQYCVCYAQNATGYHPTEQVCYQYKLLFDLVIDYGGKYLLYLKSLA